jgi:hypothetical protein
VVHQTAETETPQDKKSQKKKKNDEPVPELHEIPCTPRSGEGGNTAPDTREREKKEGLDDVREDGEWSKQNCISGKGVGGQNKGSEIIIL